MISERKKKRSQRLYLSLQKYNFTNCPLYISCQFSFPCWSSFMVNGVLPVHTKVVQEFRFPMDDLTFSTPLNPICWATVTLLPIVNAPRLPQRHTSSSLPPFCPHRIDWALLFPHLTPISTAEFFVDQRVYSRPSTSYYLNAPTVFQITV